MKPNHYIFRSRKGAVVHERQHCGKRLLLKCCKNPEEGDDKNKERLSHSKNKSLQGYHPLPCSLVHPCNGSTFKQRKTEETIISHEITKNT